MNFRDSLNLFATIFSGAISGQQDKNQLGLSRPGSIKLDPLTRSISGGNDKLGRSSSNPTDRLGRSISNSIEIPSKPEFLSFVASRITQPGPRRNVRILVMFCLIGFGFATLCTGGLAVFIYPTWWLSVIAWIFSAIPLVISYMASLTGRRVYIYGTCFGCLTNVFAAIAILCVVMTNISNAVTYTEYCKSQLTCDYSDHRFYLSGHRAVITAIVTLYAISSVVSNGVGMVYSFFLARKCRKQPTNWLTSNLNKRVSMRAPSTITGPQVSLASSSIV